MMALNDVCQPGSIAWSPCLLFLHPPDRLSRLSYVEQAVVLLQAQCVWQQTLAACSPALRPRVELLVNRPQAVLVHVRVDLRGGDVAVAEEFLDDAEVRAAADEVGGEAVAEGVGGDGLEQA